MKTAQKDASAEDKEKQKQEKIPTMMMPYALSNLTLGFLTHI